MIGIRTLILFIIFFGGYALKSSSQSIIENPDFVYLNSIFDEKIKTISLQNEQNSSQYPLIQLGFDEQLTLRFDDLTNVTRDFSYFIIHCTPNWTKSSIEPNEYIKGYQEDNISTYNFSENTAQNYVHYQAKFPHDNLKLLKSGNYALVVFKNFNRSEIAFIKRFHVVQNQVKITPTPQTPLDFETKYTHHEIDFKVNIESIKYNDVFNEFSCVVTQNDGANNSRFIDAPRFVNDKEMIFDLDKKNTFEAGNEYRTFDLRSLTQKGEGISNILYMDSMNHVLLNSDSKRVFKSYSSSFDNNGYYFIKNDLSRNDYFGSDYAWVNFTLSTPKSLDSGLVYIYGALTNFELIPEAKLVYNEKTKAYEGSLYLKQGVYDYTYVYLKDGKQSFTYSMIDGNFYQTQNLYSIFVYHKSFEDYYHKLVGVHRFVFNR